MIVVVVIVVVVVVMAQFVILEGLKIFLVVK